MELFLYFLEEVQAAPGRLALLLLVTSYAHSLPETLFTPCKKGECPATVNLETWMHAFMFAWGFIPGFGFTDDLKIRMESSA